MNKNNFPKQYLFIKTLLSFARFGTYGVLSVQFSSVQSHYKINGEHYWRLNVFSLYFTIAVTCFAVCRLQSWRRYSISSDPQSTFRAIPFHHATLNSSLHLPLGCFARVWSDGRGCQTAFVRYGLRLMRCAGLPATTSLSGELRAHHFCWIYS